MNIDAEKLFIKLDQINLKSLENSRLRALSLFSASIVFTTPNLIQKSYNFAIKESVPEKQLYEVLLQSYLFLGFPRTLIAFENLREHFNNENGILDIAELKPEDLGNWKENGLQLCQKIYGDNFERLSSRVLSYSKEL